MTAECPGCHRPLATAQPRCLYCGAALPPALVEQARALREHTEATAVGPAIAGAAPEEELGRDVVLLDITGADASRVAEALGLGGFDAGQRVRRGGWQLHRILPENEAHPEVARLVAAGLRAVTLPASEVEAAADPELIRGVRADRLLFGNEELGVAARDILLVVVGVIRREYQRPSGPKRLLAPPRDADRVVEEAVRFHIHRRADARPIEIDPQSFVFEGASAPTSTLLRVRSWLADLTVGVPWDDGFRTVPATLGVSPLPPPGAEMRGVLGGDRSRPVGVVLDNLRQFRFHSAWRGILERRLRAG